VRVRHRSPLSNALVAQLQERRTSNAGDPGGRPGGGAILGDVCSVEASLSCKQAVVSATLTVSTNYPVAQQNPERFPAKEEAASAILAGITISWMVKHCVAVPCLENR
jgi:hypothetical protein